MRCSAWRALPRLLTIGSLVSACAHAPPPEATLVKQMDADEVHAGGTVLKMVDQANTEIVGQLFTNGGSTKAVLGADGIFRTEVRIPLNQLIWQPAIIQMEHGGELEIDVFNTDQTPHGMYIASNPEHQVVVMPVHTGARVKVRLDQPGLYWFGCPISDHAGRGMLGLVLVSGEVPPEARLDRPKQKRP